MRDDQHVPAPVQNLAHVALDMAVAVGLGRQKVAAPCVMPARQEGIADRAGEFAGNEYLRLLSSASIFGVLRASRK